MKPIVSIALCWLLVFSAGTLTAAQAEKPVWWPQVNKTAERHGYGIVTPAELERLYAGDESDWLLVDVRPDYEFEEGSLPGAVNLEFHQGHRTDMTEAERRAARELFGPNPNRLLVFYCRSYK
jgi:3-mercaptopyruvate sulfurtransferase SseA